MKFTICFLLIALSSQLQAQNTETGNTFSIQAPQLKTEKKIWVSLPKNYESTDKTFPVMYVVDGRNAFDGPWEFDETLKNAKARTIVIGVELNESLATLNEIDRYVEFVASVLKPYVDKTYRTQAETGDTALLGIGSGGMMAFYGALKHPEVFGRIGCFSPVSGKYWQEIVSLMAKTPDFSKTRIYFLNGESTVEAVNYIEHWVNTKRCSCKKFNKKTYVKGQPDDEKLWREGFKKAYLWLF